MITAYNTSNNSEELTEDDLNGIADTAIQNNFYIKLSSEDPSEAAKTINKMPNGPVKTRLNDALGSLQLGS